MSAVAIEPHYTPEQYLDMERKAAYKSEYVAGRIYAMAGASLEHNTVAGNTFGEIHSQFKGRSCRAYISDMRVRVGEALRYTYPDVVAVCGTARFDDSHQDTLLNPTVLIEVLSPSTEAEDRGWKFADYRRLESLQEYVLIAQDRITVERFRRRGEEWVLNELRDMDDVLTLESIGCTITLRDIYDKVEFPAPIEPNATDGSRSSEAEANP